MSFNIHKIVRKHLGKSLSYKSARKEFSGKAEIFLDANENPYTVPYNRYPDTFHIELREKVAKLYNISIENLYFGNGSDEVIDSLFKVFCDAKKDSVIITPPTFTMYEFLGKLYNVDIVNIPLDSNFDLQEKKIIKTLTQKKVKLIFLCHPNNPTGNAMSMDKIELILKKAKKSIVVVDQAYIDFCTEKSVLPLLKQNPNLIILQTFSKAWGLAGLRIGYAIASKEIIQYINQIKLPYNINSSSQRVLLEALEKKQNLVAKHIHTLLRQREYVEKALSKLPIVKEVFPSDANFLLVKFKKGEEVFKHLLKNGIIVRSRIKDPYCLNSLRISIGTVNENKQLIQCLKNFSS